MNWRSLVAVGACLALAVVALGCGGGDSSTEASTTNAANTASMTKAEFIAYADPICQKANKRKLAMVRAYGVEHHLGPRNPLAGEEAARLMLTVVLPDIKAQAEKLAAMEAPPNDAHDVDAIALEILKAVEKAELKPKLIFQHSTSPFLKPNAMARKFGFKVCGQN